MSSSFSVYFKLGFPRTLDRAAYDHMAFLLALIAGFTYFDWKKLVILVTAFTVGHCITLYLAGADIIKVSSDLEEVGIARSV